VAVRTEYDEVRDFIVGTVAIDVGHLKNCGHSETTVSTKGVIVLESELAIIDSLCHATPKRAELLIKTNVVDNTPDSVSSTTFQTKNPVASAPGSDKTMRHL
jgi:hypothetical protein